MRRVVEGPTRSDSNPKKRARTRPETKTYLKLQTDLKRAQVSTLIQNPTFDCSFEDIFWSANLHNYLVYTQ